MLGPHSCCLVVIDVQDRLFAAVGAPAGLPGRLALMARAARGLGAGVVFTEQYPKGLGPTVEPLRTALEGAPRVEKTSFDCLAEPAFAEVLRGQSRGMLVFTGIETHICVEQTVESALRLGYRAAVLSDGVQSVDPVQKGFALARMEKKGVEVATIESVVFAWLGGSSNPRFKEFQKALLDLKA